MLDLLGASVLDGSLILASGSGDEGDIRFLGLILLFSGFVFYAIVYLRYRNTDKRHRHESETEATMLDVQASDQHINTLTGVSNARLRGANNREVRAAKRGFLDSAAAGSINDALGKLPGRPQL